MESPPLELPPDLFAAVLELEELARIVGRTPPTGSGLEHVQAVVNAGAARDRLAVLILERGVWCGLPCRELQYAPDEPAGGGAAASAR